MVHLPAKTDCSRPWHSSACLSVTAAAMRHWTHGKEQCGFTVVQLPVGELLRGSACRRGTIESMKGGGWAKVKWSSSASALGNRWSDGRSTWALSIVPESSAKKSCSDRSPKGRQE